MKKKSLKILIGVLCVVLLTLAILAAVLLDGSSPKKPGKAETPTQDSTSAADQGTPPANDSGNNNTGNNNSGNNNSGNNDSGNNQPGGSNPGNSGSSDNNNGTGNDPSNGQVTPPEDLPPAIEIPPIEDPETGKPVPLVFPFKIAEYGLTLEKIAPYSGMYVEDGTNANVENVAMLLVTNNGSFPVEYAQIHVTYGQQTLQFDISALPTGEKLVVQEKTGKKVPAGDATAANIMVVQKANMELSSNQVRVTDNGNNTLTIQNLTNETISTVRVFYKYYMENEDVFVGGIAFTARVVRLGAGSSITIQPSHYTSQNSRVVMVLTYDSEV